ncbi:MAG: ATP-binding protein [Nitrosopumilus sp.]|nr:ATP-binding protein [Nitrosopumilus sp.]
MNLLGVNNSSSANKKLTPFFEYSYIITPGNFLNLSEENKQKKLGQFFDVLRIIESPIRITMSKKTMLITIEGKEKPMPVMQVHIESNEPLSDILNQVKFDFEADQRPPNLIVKKEYMKSMMLAEITDDNLESDPIHTSTFCLESLPARLSYAWITSIFTACSHIQVWLAPIDIHNAEIRLNRFIHFIEEDAKTSQQSKEIRDKAINTRNLLNRSETKLYEIIVNCTVMTTDKTQLKAEEKKFIEKTRQQKGSFHLLAAQQAQVFFEGFGQKLTFDLGSCSILYAFASADMLELPNGIPVGRNIITKGPVIFDILKRTNLNVGIIGTSGSGKSYTTKILIYRLSQKYPDSHIYIVDPTDEYGSIAEFLGMEKLDITGEDELGLDPFQILKPVDAADILGEITKAPDQTRIQFQKYSDKAKSLSEFYYLLNKKDKSYLEHLIDGPLSKIMSGSPKITTQKKLILSMGKGSTASESEAMILVLLLNKIYKICNELPVKTRKIIVIDEAWRMFKMPRTAKYIDMIVRMGRKMNIMFVFVSQRVDDIAADSGGIGKIIDNMATKIMLGLNEQAADDARDVLKLSEHERDYLTKFSAGQALFLADDYKVVTKFEPTEEEREMFDTTPTE